MSENTERLGIILRKGLNEIAERNSLIILVRGKGLLITENQILECLAIIEKSLNQFIQ